MKFFQFILLFCSLLLSGFAEPIVVAHRGASHDAPENTLPAFKLAWEQKADAIEADFHLSKDGRLVCIHDPRTKKYSNRDLVVAETNFDDLRKLDVGLYKDKKYRGTFIPSMSEVLATVPEGKKVYLEMKCSSPKAIPVLLEAIKSSGLKASQVVIISFHAQFLKTLKKQAPQLKTYWLLSFKRKSKKLVPDLGTTLAKLKSIDADGLSSNAPHLTNATIIKIKQAGFEHHVWTVDEPEVAKVLEDWGTQSITTNRPGLIRSALGLTEK